MHYGIQDRAIGIFTTGSTKTHLVIWVHFKAYYTHAAYKIVQTISFTRSMPLKYLLLANGVKWQTPAWTGPV